MKLKSVQDDVVSDVVATFASSEKPPRVKDRRTEPSHGYRAVHVIVFEDGLPVKIQVRTELQHLWAQVFERLADAWGRPIRYGGDPTRPDSVALTDEPPLTRRDVVVVMHRLSDEIDQVERARVDVLIVQEGRELYTGDEDEDEYQALATDLAESTARLAQLEDTMRQTLQRIAGSATREVRTL